MILGLCHYETTSLSLEMRNQRFDADDGHANKEAMGEDGTFSLRCL